MNAPVIWIALPIGVAFVLFLIRRKRILSIYLGGFFCLSLVFLALVMPIGEMVRFGNLSMQVDTTLKVLGRQLILDQGDTAILILTYGMGAFWFFGALAARPPAYFVSVSLITLAILVAAVSVDPFLFSALLIEVAVLISVPLLVIQGKPAGKGIQRYLVFLTLGMPFILLAGWALGGSGMNLGDPNLILSATLLLGLGFAFLLAIFPFYSWIPLVAAEASPYSSGFLFAILPVMILIILLDFINGLAIIRESSMFFQAILYCGVVMIVTGGIWAAFQKNLARMMGYAVIVETGFFLLAIGMQSRVGLEYFSLTIVPRMVAIGILALGLTAINRSLGSLEQSDLGGLFRKIPIAAGGIIAAFLSLAGLPLLAEFSLKFGLLTDFSAAHANILGWVFIGMAGLFISAFRFLAVFIGEPGEYQSIHESRLSRGLILAGVILLLLMGLIPSLFLRSLPNILQSFPSL